VILDDIFLAIVELAKRMFSSFVSVPEVLSRPFLPIPFSLLIFLAVLTISLLISKFSKIKITLYLLLVMLVSGFVLGGFYFMILVFAISLPLLFLVKIKIKKKDDDFGGGDDLDIGDKSSSKDMDIGSDDLSTPESDLGSDLGGGTETDSGLGDLDDDGLGKTELDEKPDLPTDIEKTKPEQRTCPYCGMQLAYIPQYRRFYCYQCRRYI